jgi:hypothetical protein
MAEVVNPVMCGLCHAYGDAVESSPEIDAAPKTTTKTTK